MILKRKIYDKMLELKRTLNGKKRCSSRTQGVSANQRSANCSGKMSIAVT